MKRHFKIFMFFLLLTTQLWALPSLEKIITTLEDYQSFKTFKADVINKVFTKTPTTICGWPTNKGKKNATTV